MIELSRFNERQLWALGQVAVSFAATDRVVLSDLVDEFGISLELAGRDIADLVYHGLLTPLDEDGERCYQLPSKGPKDEACWVLWAVLRTPASQLPHLRELLRDTMKEPRGSIL